MRVLIFAYDFPPVLAAQSLRWAYLCRELAFRGVEVDVLAPRIRDIWGFRPIMGELVRIHRCFPGPFVAFSGWLGGRLSLDKAVLQEDRCRLNLERPMIAADALPFRLYRGIRNLLDQILFPDLRTEWLPFAWRRAKALYRRYHYDLVISSHEPGVDLLLGLLARRAWGIPWIADLADPLLAPYTPRWRTPLDRALEARTCRSANGVMVTTESAGSQLARRHGVPNDRFLLVRQGFDVPGTGEISKYPPPWPMDRFTLLFTGTFYRGFREPSPLIDALTQVEGVQVVIIGDLGGYATDFAPLGERVILLGKLSHEYCLAWQRSANVLLNLGNRQNDQVPGKIYEYLGAARPILHIASSPSDPVPAFLAQIRRGRSTAAEPMLIAQAINEMNASWRSGQLDCSFDLGMDKVMEYTWSAQAARLHQLMLDLLDTEPKAIKH